MDEAEPTAVNDEIVSNLKSSHTPNYTPNDGRKKTPGI